jgi:ribosomal subunit interface protein
MRIQVTGRQIELGDALRTRITDDLAKGVEKYFSRATEGVVTVGKNGVGFEVDCLVHLSSGISLQAQGHGGDAHAAFDDALEKLEKRVRRYKRRLKNHHTANKSPLPAEAASAYVLAPITDEDEVDVGEPEGPAGEHGPLVIAETKSAVKTMAVATAVMQLELTDSPALMFRNAAHGGLNVVYKRSDGNIGWIDPQRAL